MSYKNSVVDVPTSFSVGQEVKFPTDFNPIKNNLQISKTKDNINYMKQNINNRTFRITNTDISRANRVLDYLNALSDKYNKQRKVRVNDAMEERLRVLNRTRNTQPFHNIRQSNRVTSYGNLMVAPSKNVRDISLSSFNIMKTPTDDMTPLRTTRQSSQVPSQNVPMETVTNNMASSKSSDKILSNSSDVRIPPILAAKAMNNIGGSKKKPKAKKPQATAAKKKKPVVTSTKKKAARA